MGQKVHPRGLRLGIIYNWSSRWFFSNKKAYREALLSDSNIRTLLMKKLSFASITQIDIERAINKMTVVIHSVKPGMIIGRGGKGLEEVKKFISSYFVKQYSYQYNPIFRLKVFDSHSGDKPWSTSLIHSKIFIICMLWKGRIKRNGYGKMHC